MKLPVALILALVLALPEVPAAAAGAPDIPDAKRKLAAALRMPDRDVAVLEAALETAISELAKRQSQEDQKALQELRKHLGALRTFKTEKARIVLKVEQSPAGSADQAKRAAEAQELGCLAQGYSTLIGMMIAQVIIAIISVVTSVWTGGSQLRLVAIVAAIISLTATLVVSQSEVLRALRFTGEGDTATRWMKDNPWFATTPKAVDLVTAFVTNVNSAIAAARKANAAARDAQARLQAAPKPQAPAFAAPKKPLNAIPALPSRSPTPR